MASDSGQAKRLPLGLKLAYGLPSFPGSAMAIPIGVYMTKFYSDTVGVALGFIALAQVLARSVDAVSDPLMGWISDRTRTRWGRRRPWMLLGAPFAAISMVVLFGPPSDIDPRGHRLAHQRAPGAPHRRHHALDAPALLPYGREFKGGFIMNRNWTPAPGAASARIADFRSLVALFDPHLITVPEL